jgi:hypothetical protein
MIHDKKIKDMTGKFLELGHIVAVRYEWNSYVGVIRMSGMCWEGAKRHCFFGPHDINHYTYQVLGHVDREHPDYNEDIHTWYFSEDGKCPIKIRVYDNMRTNEVPFRKMKIKKLRDKIKN